MIGLLIAATFQFYFMALAIDFTDRHGHSNKTCCQLQPKKWVCCIYGEAFKRRLVYSVALIIMA